MSKSLRMFAFLGILGVIILGGAIAQENPLVGDQHRTGLIPLNAEQWEEVLTTWPRVDRVNFNWLGLERINKVKALKGKSLLSPDAVKPVGQEVESSIHAPGALSLPLDLNQDLLGDLPVFVDNSTDDDTDQFFPDIRNQGVLGSCASFATTYYQLTYMTAFQRGQDIGGDEDNTYKYSPKWSYNMLNDGANEGTTITENFTLLEKHGAATWAEFPYDTNYLAWLLNADAWRNALSVRARPTQYSWHTDTDSGLEVVKQLLANGYVLTFGTYVNSWQFTTIQDDPSTLDDDAAVGKNICYWVSGTSGGHAMTIVGYNDAIWTDINQNSTVDPGEKGALRIANSWGTAWNPADGGFIWLAYDALRNPTAVSGGPSTGNRVAAFTDNVAFVLTARDGYSPMLMAEFTINHAKRNQLIMILGQSATSVESPTETWTPTAFALQGGAYAFDGTTVAVDGTFVLDYSDILPSTSELRRFYVGMSDSTTGDTATLSAFKIIDTTTGSDNEVVSVLVPRYADGGQQVFSWVDHAYTGPTYNNPPVVSNGQVVPASGTPADTFGFYAWYKDADGDLPTVKSVYIDGTPFELTYYSGSGSISASNGWYRYLTTLTVGTHNFRFYVEDGYGESAQDPISLAPPPYSTYAGPVVFSIHNVSAPTTPSGESHPAPGSSYTYSTSGSICSSGHDVQYQFDWGDGTTSGWLPVGQTSAQHAWNSTGAFGVRAQARCAVETAIVSAWSGSLTVYVSNSIPFTEDFAEGATGWLQQSSGFSATLWYLSDTSYAGGSPYEARCQFYNVNPGTTRLITPALDTTGYSTLSLSFKHFLNADGTGCVLKIQTSPDKATWTDEAWAIDSTSSDVGPETVETVLTHNLNITTTYVAFVVTGNLYNFDYWYVDDISITSASSPKVDFNGDGQEDILWRYYGGGAYQGLNLVWLMNQTETGATIPLETSQTEAVAESLITGAPRNAASRTLQAVEIPRNAVTAPKSSFKTILSGGKAPALKPKIAMKNPMDLGRELSPKDRGRAIGKEPSSVSALKDAVLMGIAGSGTTELASIALGTEVVVSVVADTAWEIAGTADFNGDGKTDILWRYYGEGAYQGLNDIWFMNGTSFESEDVFSQVTDTNWRIAGTGDFNADGKTDILWRYYGVGAYQGLNVIWYMDGSVFQSEAVFSVITDTNWKIASTVDFNSDGKTDILWRYYGVGAYQGLNVVWFMDGSTFQSEAVFSQITDTAWEIAATGDFDGDGKTDILWRYYGVGAYQGMNDIWYMDGVSFLSEEIFSVITDTSWRIVNR